MYAQVAASAATVSVKIFSIRSVRVEVVPTHAPERVRLAVTGFAKIWTMISTIVEPVCDPAPQDKSVAVKIAPDPTISKIVEDAGLPAVLALSVKTIPVCPVARLVLSPAVHNASIHSLTISIAVRVQIHARMVLFAIWVNVNPMCAHSRVNCFVPASAHAFK